jgi:16S rRNA (cytosine1402-N4)-methyltransferase
VAVNRELENLDKFLDQAPRILRSGGRALFISFHSLEDRRVKDAARLWAGGCVCPPGLPACVCGRKPQFRILNRKVIRPSENEIEHNPRSRSAKMRVIEKI